MVYDQMRSLDERAQMSIAKIPDLKKLITHRATLQKRATKNDFQMLDKVLTILKGKFLKRAARLPKEKLNAENELKDMISGIEEQAKPGIVQYFKDLVVEAKDTASQIHRDIENGHATLQSVNRIIGDFDQFLVSVAQRMKTAIMEDNDKVTGQIDTAKKKFQRGMGATLDKYQREEEEAIDKLAEKYLSKVEEEELNRKGDGFDQKGVIKTINDKWIKDQADLVTDLKASIRDMKNEYTTTIDDMAPLMQTAGESTAAAVALKRKFVDSTSAEGGVVALLLDGLEAKVKTLPHLANITANISSMTSQLDAKVISMQNSGKANATKFMNDRINLIKQRYNIIMRHLKKQETNFTKMVPMEVVSLDALLDEHNASVIAMKKEFDENKKANFDRLAQMEQALTSAKAASVAIRNKKAGKYRADLEAPTTFLKKGFDKSNFEEAAKIDAKRREEYLAEAVTVMSEAEQTQKKTISRKVHDSTEFLKMQLEVAEALRAAIEKDMAGVEKSARAMRAHINRLRVQTGQAAVMEKRLRTRIDPEAEEMKNATALASEKLREVALELNAGLTENVRTQFANDAHIVDKEFAGLSPRLEHALALIKKRIEDAHDASVPILNRRIAELKSMIAKATAIGASVKQKESQTLSDIAVSAKEMKGLRTRMNQMKPEMLMRVKKAFAAMRSLLEEHIRDHMHGATVRGKKAVEKAAALAAKLDKMRGFDVGKMGLARVDTALQLSKDAKKKAKLARDRAELVEEAAAGSMTDQLDRVAELTNSETGIGKEDIREISNILGSTQQKLRAESLRADAKAQKLRADVMTKSDLAERDLESDGREADSDIHTTDEDIGGLVGKAASIVNAEAGVKLPGDGWLQGYSEEFAGITGMEGDVFQRLAANQHRLLSSEKQELALIVGAVQQLAESFNQEFDKELAVEPHEAKDAARKFGESSARAAAATEDVLEEARAVGDGRMPGVEATAEAAHDLASDVRAEATNVETGMEKLMKSGITSTEFEHESEMHDLGLLVGQLESAFTPLPKLTDVLENVSSVEIDATHHLATLTQNTKTQRTRVNGIVGAAEDAENGLGHIEDELDGTKPHRPVVPDMPSPDGAKSVDGLLVRMSGDASALSHSADQKVSDAFSGFGDSRAALLNKRRGLRNEVNGDVQEGAADESAVTSALRSESVGDLTEAMGSEATAGEIYVNMESTVNALQDKLQRLTDSAIAFGKVAAADVKPRAELLAAARQLQNLESKKNTSDSAAAAAAAATAGANAGCALDQTLSETSDECVAKPWAEFVGCAQEAKFCDGVEKNAWVADHCCKTCKTNCTIGFDMLAKRSGSDKRTTTAFVQTSDGDARRLIDDAQTDMSKLRNEAANDADLRAQEQAMDRELALMATPPPMRSTGSI